MPFLKSCKNPPPPLWGEETFDEEDDGRGHGHRYGQDHCHGHIHGPAHDHGHVHGPGHFNGHRYVHGHGHRYGHGHGQDLNHYSVLSGISLVFTRRYSAYIIFQRTKQLFIYFLKVKQLFYVHYADFFSKSGKLTGNLVRTIYSIRARN